MILLRMLYDIGKSVYTQGHDIANSIILHFLEIVSLDGLNLFAGYRHSFLFNVHECPKGHYKVFQWKTFIKYSGRYSARMEKILWETLKLLNERRPHAWCSQYIILLDHIASRIQLVSKTLFASLRSVIFAKCDICLRFCLSRLPVNLIAAIYNHPFDVAAI